MSEINGEKTNHIFPSMRALMGDREYFIATMTFADVREWVKHIDEIHERQDFKSWLQRELKPKRKEEIANYLLTQDQRFFNSIVVGIYHGEPDWFPVSFESSQTFTSLEDLGANQKTLGFLKLSGNEDIFAIDGQHRVEGIRRALELDPEIGSDEQSVIFVAHKTDEEGHIRTRRLFSTLNRYAKPVSRGEIVALSEDDSFAIVTRRLTEQFDYLKGDIVAFTTETNIPANNSKCITTILSLYDTVKLVSVAKTRAGAQVRKRLEVGPPNPGEIDEIYAYQVKLWLTLMKYFTPVRNVLKGSDSAGKHRRADGGHLLFRPVGLKPFVSALRILLDRGFELERSVEALSMLPMNLEDVPWRDVLWNPEKSVVITGNDTLAQNLLLYLLQEEIAGPKSYNLESKYSKAVGHQDRRLKTIKRQKI